MANTIASHTATSVSVLPMTTDPGASGDLTDDALQGEIELVGDLVVAASASERPLTDEEIDKVLGVTPKPAHAKAAHDAPRRATKRQHA
jgi:hypothetical protein